LLFNAPTVDGSNFTNTSFQNIVCSVQKGLELNVNADVLIKNDELDFNWTNFNATTFQRKLRRRSFDRIELGGISPVVQVQTYRNQTGFTPKFFYVYKAIVWHRRRIEGAYADLDASRNLLMVSDSTFTTILIQIYC
jgi:hypothetical protein